MSKKKKAAAVVVAGGSAASTALLAPPAPLEVQTQPAPIQVSVIIPMFNEEENITRTMHRVADVMRQGFPDGAWEIILVNDGSTDETWPLARKLAVGRPWLRVAGYARNRGRGMALRTGFAVARGQWIVATDADLSYAPEQILDLLAVLREREEVDMVLASAYMPGGGTENVPAMRLLVSRLGNRLLSWFMSPSGQRIHTFTCVFRAYRRHVIDSLELESEGKDIHLEIVSKALMLGYRMAEIPALLRGRERGYSKFRFRSTAGSHMVFALFERPILLFGLVGMLGMLGGLGIFGWAFSHWIVGTEFNWNRPMMTIMVLLFLGGLQMLAFGIIGTQFVNLRKESIKIQARLRELLKAERDERP